MEMLGLLTVTNRGKPSEKWRTEKFLPHPDEVLTLSDDWLQDDAKTRWALALADVTSAFWELQDRRRSAAHQPWRTSISKIAKSTEHDPESVRQMLGLVCRGDYYGDVEHWGVEISTVGHEGPFDADPERILRSKTIYFRFITPPGLQAALDDIDRIFGPGRSKKEN